MTDKMNAAVDAAIDARLPITVVATNLYDRKRTSKLRDIFKTMKELLA